MITTVIFDIGNVLAAYDWEDALKRLGYSKETREIIGNAVFRSADWNEMDRGVLTLEELLQRFIKRAPEYEKEIRQAIYNYKDMAHQYDYTKPWLKELKEKGLRLYYLSNYGEFGVQETLEALDFRELMDGGIFSYEVKMIKPAAGSSRNCFTVTSSTVRRRSSSMTALPTPKPPARLVSTASSLRVMKMPVRSLKACWPGKGKAPSPSRSE